MPSLLLNEGINRLLLKYSTGSGKTLVAILLANKYREINKWVIIITYMAHWFYEDILNFYKMTHIAQEDIDEMNRLWKIYLKSGEDNDKNIYKNIRRKLINSVGIEIIGYKKLSKIIINDETNEVNDVFIENMANSVLICDEIHSAYSTENNTYGKAI